jgi:hypothetical protein
MNRVGKTILRSLILLALVFLGVGCATIHPWDRDLLAEKKMQFVPNPMVHAIDEHIYFSKAG